MTLVVGIDWATDPKNRGIVRLQVNPDSIAVVDVMKALDDAKALSACRDPEYAVVAVDIPFGWHSEFKRFVAESTPTAQREPPSSDDFRFRLTDRLVREEAKKEPLPVSADRIAMGARAWAALVAKGLFAPAVDVAGVLRQGGPTIIEVYPGASARVLAKVVEGAKPPQAEPSYKKDAAVRRRLVLHVASLFRIDCGSFLDALVSADDDSDETDAFLAAVTGAIYLADVRGEKPLAGAGWRVRFPLTGEEKRLARIEGWIFFPVSSSSPIR